MQLKIYQRVTQLLIAFIVSVAVIIGFLIANNDFVTNHKGYVFAIVILYPMIGLCIIKMIENNWDKRKIQKMAFNGQIALANITNAKPYMRIKDSSIRSYRLWEIEITYYDQDMNKHEATFYEKMNYEVTEIPKCTVYVTHNPDKPEEKFIIQNVIISHIPSLMPIVTKYENNKNIKIKYMDVYYNTGLVIRPFKESIKINKEIKDLVVDPQESED